MKKFQISISFEDDRDREAAYASENAIIRGLAGFIPSPVRVRHGWADFAREAESDYLAGVEAVKLFDQLKAHCAGASIHPERWEKRPDGA